MSYSQQFVYVSLLYSCYKYIYAICTYSVQLPCGFHMGLLRVSCGFHIWVHVRISCGFHIGECTYFVRISCGFHTGTCTGFVRISCGFHIGACTNFVRISCGKVTVISYGKWLQNLILFP